jgi:hypothetical protein
MINPRNLLLTLFIIVPNFVFAQILITEIMYDLEGSDSGREWIEITNIGSESLDLTNWKFYENQTNHGLSIYQGDVNLGTLESAIFVADSDKFLADWPNFDGVIFDSSFSLNNTGELLSLRDPELIDIDSVQYLSDWGADGDGNSLQLINTEWLPAVPSPGVYSSGSIQEEDEVTEVTEEKSSSGSKWTPMVNFPNGEIKTRIIAPKTILSGASTFFRSESLGVENEKLENARHLWNFGDGSIREGEQVLYNYIYPGEYLIYLDVSSENFNTNDKIYIKVVLSPLSISEAKNEFIKLLNDSKEEIDMSFWIIQAGEKFFHIPKNTFVKSEGQIIFPREITGLDGSLEPVNLLYPNGAVAYEFKEILAPELTPKMSTLGIDILGQESFSTRKESQAIVVSESKEKSSKEKSVEINKNVSEEQIASAILAQEPLEKQNGNPIFNKWFLGVLIIIVIAIFLTFLIKKEDTIEGFRIIE